MFPFLYLYIFMFDVPRLGLVDDDPIDKKGTPIDTLSNYLAKRLAYGECFYSVVFIVVSEQKF